MHYSYAHYQKRGAPNKTDAGQTEVSYKGFFFHGRQGRSAYGNHQENDYQQLKIDLLHSSMI